MTHFKCFFSTIIFTLLSVIGHAQAPGDTIVINTFNYSQTYGINQWSPGIRDSVIDFSTLPNVSFEKVLMQYNMRCKNGSVSTGSNTDLGCGEWDASCSSYLHDSTQIDSTRYSQPSYTVSGFTGTTFNYTTIPTFTYYQFTQNNVVLNTINSETQSPLTIGSSPINSVLEGSNNSGKSQFLYTAQELTDAGFLPGEIDGFLMNALNPGNVNFLKVRILGTTSSNLDAASPFVSGFTEVYFNDYSFINGSNRIQFSTPYIWNGTDNIVIEFSFTHTEAGTDIQFEGGSSSGMSLVANNGYNINLAGNTHIEVPSTGMSSIQNEITVAFWAYGDANLLPANTTIIHANDPDGNRTLNVHLPWENSNVYFDCGNNGGSYDRIEKAATTNQLEGQWNHWAATKNAVTGSMKLYLNGVQWHSGTGKTNPIEIAEMIIGKTNDFNFNYKGRIDELTIWNSELTLSEIANWRNISIDASHPKYANLVLYYKMDEGTGLLTSNTINAENGTISNSNTWQFERGDKLSRFFSDAAVRPNLTLVSGDYDLTVTPLATLDSIQNTPNVIETYSILSHPNTLQDDEVQTVSSIAVWQATPEVIYDAVTGSVISTIPVATEQTTSPVTNLYYWTRDPAKVEIMSFVTPYGINLNLGPNGKTWTFDMTDYTPIFKGKKRMTIERGGQWMEDMDIKFLFIVGTPPREVLDLKQLWPVESRGYTSIINNDFYQPLDIVMNPDGNFFKVRTAITGHGQEGEFIPRQHYIDIDGGTNERTWTVWKECAENPIYPQGGTWVYDRAGWCPGAPTDVDHFDITSYVTPGQVANIDYSVVSGSGTSNYLVNSQLVTYGEINHTLDAAIVEVSEPSSRVEFQRFNSICHSPKVRIQNTGSTTLTSLIINYWINDAATPLTYTWTGNLDFLETEDVELPSPAELWSSLTTTNNVFKVEIASPNGGTDGYVHNNKYNSPFTITSVLPSNIVIWFKTNSAPNESSFDVRDENGNVVFQRSGMSANTQYKDTLYLDMGCYTYNVYDTGDDGISWWANSDGTGVTSIRELGAGTVKTFNGDFGDNIRFNFTVDYPLSYDELNKLENFTLYPNPASDHFTYSYRGFDQEVQLELYNYSGQLIKQESIQSVNGNQTGIVDVKDLPSGLYIVRLSDRKKSSQLKFSKQ